MFLTSGSFCRDSSSKHFFHSRHVQVKTLGILFSTFFCVPHHEIIYVSAVFCALMFASGAIIEN